MRHGRNKNYNVGRSNYNLVEKRNAEKPMYLRVELQNIYRLNSILVQFLFVLFQSN